MSEKFHPVAVPSAVGPFGMRKTSSQLSNMPREGIAALRVESVASKKRGLPLWTCPYCHEALYPHLNGRPHWQHFPGSVDKAFCIFGNARRLNQRQLEALIYRGRQKGQLHDAIVRRLENMLRSDPNVDAASITLDEYDTPISPGEHGRYPDIVCNTKFGRIVFEVQISPIFLYRIVEREYYYRRKGAHLVWVTDGVDELIRIPSYVWDMIAVQGAAAYEIPSELAIEAVSTGRFMLRKMTGLGREQSITNVGLHQLSQQRSSFADYWINERALFPPYELPTEIESKLRADLNLPSTEVHAHTLRQTIDCLLSIETGRPIGYRHENVAGVLNSVLMSETGRPLVDLIARAIQHFNPALFEEISWLQEKVLAARERCRAEEVRVLGRTSWAGKLREYLFPMWEL